MRKYFNAVLALFVLVMSVSCSNDDSGNKQDTMPNMILNFVLLEKYNIYYTKNSIPVYIIDTLSKLNNEKFEIGDSSDIGNISFSDASVGDYKYKRKLHFVLLNDSSCLLSYTEGGVGTHDIVDYFRFGKVFKHIRNQTASVISDTTKLKKFLKSQQEKVY